LNSLPALMTLSDIPLSRRPPPDEEVA